MMTSADRFERACDRVFDALVRAARNCDLDQIRRTARGLNAEARERITFRLRCELDEPLSSATRSAGDAARRLAIELVRDVLNREELTDHDR